MATLAHRRALHPSLVPWTRRRPAPLLAAAVLACLALSGCTSNGDDPGSPTSPAPTTARPTASPTASAAPGADATDSATPTATKGGNGDDDGNGNGSSTNASGVRKPDRPKDLDRTDERGAAAAATYFLKLYPYVMATGDTTEWEAMSVEGTCGFCSGIADAARDHLHDHAKFSGGKVTVETVRVGPVDPLTGGYPVDVVIAQANARLVASDGTSSTIKGTSSDPLYLDVIRFEPGWRITAVANEIPQ